MITAHYDFSEKFRVVSVAILVTQDILFVNSVEELATTRTWQCFGIFAVTDVPTR